MDRSGRERLSAPPVAAWFNPADTFTFVLDREIRRAGMPGGVCGFGLELAAVPDLARLEQRLYELVERFPVASARLEQRGKRWGWVARGRRVNLERYTCPAGTEPLYFWRRQAEHILNQPEGPDSPPLSLHWLAGGSGGMLLLRWLHPLMDARGARILLEFLDCDDPDRFRESPSLILQRLSDWSLWKKAGLFLRARRHNAGINRLDSSLPTAVEGGVQELRLRLRRYDLEESARIARSAQRYTGLAGRTLYVLGCFMRAMEAAGPAVAKAGYCIPYAYNLRRQGAPTPVFGNHVSCLFAQASRAQVRDREGLMAHLLDQYRRTVREELDLAYLPLMWLGQWLAPERYAHLLRKQRGGGELSSAWFSDIGELRFGVRGFLGVDVVGWASLTWMTLPPGLALLAGQTDGRFSLCYNFLYPAVEEAWLERVVGIMDSELLGEEG